MQKDDENSFVSAETKQKVSKSKLKASSLYNTLDILIKTSSKIITNWKIKQIDDSNRQVFYIELDKPQYQNLIEGFQFSDCHLTIHKFFKEKDTEYRNGLSLAHYTETYSSASLKKVVVIHVYFDRYGYYQHTQIKQYKESRIEENFEKELSLNANVEELLRFNIKQASFIVDTIMEQNETLRDILIAKAMEQEKELQIISQKLEKNSIQAYIKMGGNFIKTIESLNKHLDGSYDKRGEVIAKQLQFLEESQKHNDYNEKVTVTPNEVQDTILVENTVTSSNQLKSKESVHHELAALESKLRTLMKALKKSPRDINLLIKKNEQVKAIQLQLLLNSSMLSTAKGQLKSIVNNLQSLINNNQTLFEIFESEFWAGNIDVVRQIYPVIEHEIMPDYIIREILFKLVHTKPKNKEHETKLNIVFDFIYDSSSTYRIFVSSKSTLLFSVPNKNIYYSLLVTACQLDNLFAYKVLLRHGLSPNNIGAWVENIQVPALYLIAGFSEGKKIIYLEEAIKQGGHYLCEKKPILLNKKLMRAYNNPSENSIVFSKISKKNKETETFYETLLKSQNVVDWCSKIGNTEAIELFIPQLKLEDILHMLASQTIRASLSRRNMMPAPELGFYAVRSKEEAEKKSRDLLLKGYEKELVTIIIYPNQPDAPIALVQKLLGLLKEKISYYSQTAPKELRSLFDKLYKQAQNLKYAPPKSLEGVWEFDACLLLLLLEPNPTIMTIQTIMQLYCHQAVCIKNNYKEQNKRFKEFYWLAMTIGDHTQYKEELMSSKIYAFAYEKFYGETFNEKTLALLKERDVDKNTISLLALKKDSDDEEETKAIVPKTP